VLYVGDSLYDDVHGAKLAGMRVAWVKTPDPAPWRTRAPDDTELLPPDVTIASLPKLEQAVLSL